MRKSILLVVLFLLLGCATMKKSSPYAEFMVEYQIDRMSDWMLQPERSWMGNSPYLTGRFGLEWNHGIRCPEVSTSTSLFTGAPFKEKKAEVTGTRTRPDNTTEEYVIRPRDVEAELHWVRVGCGFKFGGK